MKLITLCLGFLVIGTILGSQGTIKALTSGADEIEQYHNRDSYYWHDARGKLEYKIVIWNRR